MMDIFSINRLLKYKEFKNSKIINKQIHSFNYLYLSIHLSRDARDFDSINFKLLRI